MEETTPEVQTLKEKEKVNWNWPLSYSPVKTSVFNQHPLLSHFHSLWSRRCLMFTQEWHLSLCSMTPERWTSISRVTQQITEGKWFKSIFIIVTNSFLWSVRCVHLTVPSEGVRLVLTEHHHTNTRQTLSSEWIITIFLSLLTPSSPRDSFVFFPCRIWCFHLRESVWRQSTAATCTTRTTTICQSQQSHQTPLCFIPPNLSCRLNCWQLLMGKHSTISTMNVISISSSWFSLSLTLNPSHGRPHTQPVPPSWVTDVYMPAFIWYSGCSSLIFLSIFAYEKQKSLNVFSSKSNFYYR